MCNMKILYHTTIYKSNELQFTLFVVNLFTHYVNYDITDITPKGGDSKLWET